MITVLSQTTPVAKKQHECSACEFILGAGVNGYGYTFSELRLIAKAKKQGYKIQIGQRYLKQNNVCDGEFYTFKAMPEMHQICLDHDHYEM